MKSFIWFAVLLIFLFISCDRELSVSQPDPPPPEGSFIISSQPEGYDIYIDNRITGEKTPYEFHYMEESDYEITLKHPWYIDTSISIQVNDEISSHFINSENNADFKGSIICRTYPFGANIYLDDSLVSVKTPTTISDVYPGKHKIEFELYGYRGEKLSTLVKSNNSSLVTATLEDTTIWMTYNTTNCDMVADDLNCIILNSGVLAKKQIWIGSSTKGLLSFINGQWDYLDKSNTPMASNYIARLKIGYNFDLCAVSAREVYKFNDSEYVGTFPQNKVPVLNVAYVTGYDSLGSVFYDYYITPADGLMRVSSRGDVKYITGVNSPLITAELNSIDSYFNYLVVGCAVGGFYVLKDDYLQDYWTEFDYSFLDPIYPLHSRINYSKITKREGKIKVYAAQYEAGIYIVYDIENKVVEWLPLPTTVKSIKFEGDYMWVCTFDGLYKFLGNEIIEHYTMQNSGLPSNVITDICFDGNGDIYITTPKGLCRYKREKEM